MAEITATHHHDDIASSSTASGSASTPYVHFDIFVNHFEDETTDFAMELCKRLVSRGLYVFLDGSEKEVTPRMEDAISLASLQIAIFSPNYATCKWSMDTLVKMTKSEAPILPVFYKVEPFDLRFTRKDHKGPYAQSLRAHEEKGRYDSQIIEAWRDALCDVSNISGFQLEESNGGQEVLLGKVVDSVFKTCPPRPYHVFLSHRGPDTKEKFAQPLYDRLVSQGLRVFLDKPELVGALKIETQIEVPIQFASVNIVIFSPRFPESSWCMDELFLITKATGTILPVFYEVEPSDLDGIYIETLYCHHREKQRQDTRTIEKWRDALANVPKSDEFTLAGEELKEELMDKIIERVRKYIRKPSEFMISSEEQRALKSVPNDVSKRSEAVPVEDCYVGLHEKLEDFEKAVLSQQEEKPIEAKVVGILGGVGIGKTALAKEIFKWKRSNYSESSCLFNVRNYVARKYALKDLQSMIIKDLKHSPSKEIESVEEGKEILQQHLRSCQALVILDDVDHVDQLYALTPILHPKRLILVTSRNKDVLNKFGIVDSSIYHLAGLNREDCRKLLLSYAFNLPNVLNKFGIVDSSIYHRAGLKGEDSRNLLFRAFNFPNLRHPSIYHLLGLKIQDFQNLLLSYDSDRPFPRHPSDDPVFESLVQNFVMACDGLPLPLKELGERLSGKDRSGWEEQLNQLRPNCKLLIETKLSICYDSLNEEEQQIFLDVACFFIGEDRDSATRIFGMEGLEKLENRCLLKMTSKIEMNEFLRNYGRNKANRLTPRRFWHQGTKQINDLLDKSASELAQFRGITMNGDPGDETEMPCCKQSGETFSGSTNLKFLAAQGRYVENILTRVGSPDLLWLNWYKCTHSSLPSWISMEKLRVLKVEGSKLTELWQTESQVPLQLRELNICAPLSLFPQSIGQLELLEKIVVKYSGPLPFKALPEEFCRLRSLKYLEMTECSVMMLLPDSFGDLTNLQYLDLKGASCLQMLPKSFGTLTLLKYLSLEGCSEIRELPGLEHFTSLETLDVKGCKNLESIPELGQLIKLQILDASGCSQIKRLSVLKHLNSSKTFNVSGCQKLQSIPGLAQLTKLTALNLSGCQNLQSIQGLEQLTKLQTLDVSGCGEIQTLPGLEHLTSLETFNYRGCEKLQSIDVSGSSEIHSLSDLEHLTSLKTLNVSGCKKLQRLPCLRRPFFSTLQIPGIFPRIFGNSTDMSAVNFVRFPNIRGIGTRLLTELRTIVVDPHLTSLEVLNVSGCEKLHSTAGLGQLRKLQTLDISGCSWIETVSGLEHLTSLEVLNVSGCEKLHSTARLGQLRKLQTLDVSGCSWIETVSDLEHLTSLKTLNVSGCKRLQRLPGLGLLTKLQTLNISGCRDILELPGVERLTSLETLNVSECLGLSKRKSGQDTKLTIPELGQLTKLQTLDASGYDWLESLLNLEHLISLKTLNIRNCRRLVSIPGLAYLKELQILDVSQCYEIPELPGVEHLTSLETLNVSECWGLQSLPELGQLTKLQTLDASGCGWIQSLLGLEHLTYLKMLNIKQCRNLRSIPGVEHLTSLERLDVGWHELQWEPRLSQFTKLQELYIFYCSQIKSLSDLEHIFYCSQIKSLSDLEHLTSLKTLDITGCWSLERIQTLGSLTELQKLNLSGLHSLLELPSLENLTSLETLTLSALRLIKSIPGLEHLISLKTLNVGGNLPNLTNLETLSVMKCHDIQTLSGLEDLISLKALTISQCKKLESITRLGHLTKLEILTVKQCPEIRELPGVEHAMSLKLLEVDGCPGVQWGEGVPHHLYRRLQDRLHLGNGVPDHLYRPLGDRFHVAIIPEDLT